MRPHTTQALLEPFEMRDLTLQNRVVLAPMTRGRAGDSRLATPLMAEYYAQRAGAGLVITEATTVSSQGNGWVGSPGIYTDDMGQAWTQVVDAVHAKGSPIFLQMWHCGRASHSDFHGGEPAVSASANAIAGEGIRTPLGKKSYETPRALRTDEIPGLIQDYVQAAQRAKDAGFDGVEVHSANGYLLDQFLQSRTNQRTDAYGGSIENRFRLLREIIAAISKVFPPARIGVRLAPNGVFNDMGSEDFRETFLYAAKELNTMNLAYLHVMDGLAFGFHEKGTPMTLAEFREVFEGPLMGNCGYTQESANAAIEAGTADLIAIGRPYLANPDLVERFKNGWPLAEANQETIYETPSPEIGYTDYPAYQA